MPEIATPRFVLRDLRQEDITPRYLEWFVDPAAQKHITAASSTHTLAQLRAYLAARTGRDDVLFLGIFDRTSGLHIGNVKYEPVDRTRGYAVMGILVGDPEFRGRGVAGEVIAASSRWLQAHGGIREIILGVHRDNTAAIQAYERVGFVVEPTPHVHVTDDAFTMVWRLENRETA